MTHIKNRHIKRKHLVNSAIISTLPRVDIITDNLLKLTIQISKGLDDDYLINHYSQQIKREWTKYHNRVEHNLIYDDSNLKNYSVHNPFVVSGIYEREYKITQEQQYKHINKRFIYYDISLFQIIKVLYRKHKISKFLYKKSIRNIKNKKKIPNKVLRLVNCYYSTFKSNTSKNSIQAIGKEKDNRTRLNVRGYSVVLKKRTQTRLTNLNHRWAILSDLKPNDFRNFRIDTIYQEIKQEIKIKIEQDNKLIFSNQSPQKAQI